MGAKFEEEVPVECGEPPKKKKKKSKTAVEEAPAVVEEVAPVVEEPEKKKKKKKKAAVEAAVEEEEKPAVEEEAPAVEEPEKKKKKKKSAPVEEEEAATEEPPAKKAKVEEEAKEEKVEEKTEEAEKPSESLTVFIGGLPWAATEEQVKADFAECGEIESFRFLMDRETGKPKGIAFCQYKSQEAVKKAIEFNETDYGGRTLRVRIAEDDAPGKGGKKGGKGKGKKGGMTQSEKPEDCKSVVVKNLSFETTEDQVREFFASCGTIERCKLLTDRDTGSSKGVCFVDFEGEAPVDAAIKLSDQSLGGRMIFVDYSGGGGKKGGDGKKGDGKKGGKKGDGKKGKGKKGKPADPTFAARNGSIQASTGKKATFDSDSD